MRQKTILCIDDEPCGLILRKKILEQAGHQVLTASRGRDGVFLFRRSDVDLVILDYEMPEMNGHEVARQLRKLKPNVPIIMLGHEEACRGSRNLVDGFVWKGEGPSALFAGIAKVFTEWDQVAA